MAIPIFISSFGRHTRVSVHWTERDLIADLVEYHNGALDDEAEDDMVLDDSLDLEDVVAALDENLNQAVHTEQQALELQLWALVLDTNYGTSTAIVRSERDAIVQLNDWLETDFDPDDPEAREKIGDYLDARSHWYVLEEHTL